MLPQFVQLAKSGDGQKFLEWCKNQPEVDLFIPYHPGTFTLKAFDKTKDVGFMPVQRPYVLETLASNPEATDMEIASALREFVQYLVSRSQAEKVAEIYFLESDKDTSKFAGNHIFEELPYRVYRCRISDLEPKEKTDEGIQ